jgi:ElaB/YqjD/DUF883 family membrane-anchored ribosome-binding protein
MSDSTSTRSSKASSATEALREGAADAMGKISDVAQQAMGEAKKSASSLAAAASERAKGAAQERVSEGADFIGHVAASIRAAARDLDPNAPQVAGFVHEAADRIDEFSRDMRTKTVEELFETTSDFARRQPAMLFAAAAACGFLLFRMVKSSSGASGQGDHGRGYGGAAAHADSPPITSGQFHGP